MFTFSKTYIFNDRACVYRGESGLGYSFSYLDDSASFYVALADVDSIKPAVPAKAPVL